MTYNPMRGEASAAIGERTLALVIDNLALREMERFADASFLELVGELLEREAARRPAKITTLQAILYGATREHHPEIDPIECGDLVLTHNIALRTALIEALGAAMPKAAASGEAKAPTTPAPGTGTMPSGNGSKRADRSGTSGRKRPER